MTLRLDTPDFKKLDIVYHSESMHEMEVNADLQCVDLCSLDVQLFLAKTTAYHHAFWPHTAKRFLAFKNILRHNKDVRASLRDGKLLAKLADIFSALASRYNSDSAYRMPGTKQELKNIKQVISIVKKAVAEST